MRHLLLAFYFAVSSFCCSSQITIKTNLPGQLAPNSEINFEVVIQKGTLKNFSKYHMVVPEGIEIREVDSKTGTFTFEKNKAQIIWAITPPESELVVIMKFVSANSRGPQTISQRFYYLERGDKREVEIPDFVVNISEGDSSSNKELLANSEKEFVRNDLPNVTKDSLSDNPEEVKQQIAQLYKDSKEAYEIGNREKRNAEVRLAEADKEINAAADQKNLKERKAVTDRAIAKRTQALNDLEVATRILTLAKSLEENAEEIEKLNQTIDSIDVKATSAVTNPAASSPTSTTILPTGNRNLPAKTSGSDTKSIYKPYAANGQNLGEIQQQVMQIKRDAAQAREVGEAEKRKAEQKLEEANKSLKMASYMPEVEEKKMAIDKANADKEKAQKDIDIAAKILALAKSLEDNAKDIENLNIPADKRGQATTTQTSVVVSPINQPQTNSEVSEPKKQEEKKVAKIVKPEEPYGVPATVANGLVYRIQIGSFTKSPDKTQFRPLGKVEVVLENGVYKALYGSFRAKDEALKKRSEVISKGFDGFVVLYQDGLRVK